MNWVDLFVVISLLAMAANGVKRGLFREIVAVLAVGAGLIVAINYTDWLADQLAGIINFSPHLLFTVSFVLMFIFALIAAKLLGLIFYKMVNPESLNTADKLGGVIIGGVRGVLVLGVLFTLMLFFPSLSRLNSSIDESLLAPSIRQVIPKLYDYTEFTHPSNPSFVYKVRQVMLPFKDRSIEIAKKDNSKIMKSEGDEIVHDVEHYFGEALSDQKGSSDRK